MPDKEFRWNDSQRDILRKILYELQDGMEINAGSLTVNAITDEELRATPLEVKGKVADNAAETENPVPVAGKAVTSASYAPAYTANDRSVLAIDKDSGELLTRANIRKLTAADDFVSAAGDVAHDSPDAGLPLKIGFKALSADPTAVAANDRVNAYADLLGRQVMVIGGNDSATVFGSAARTATVTSATQTTPHTKGLMLFFNVTAVSATPIVTPALQVQDPVSSTWVDFLTLPTITATGLFVAQFYPGDTDSLASYPYRASVAVPRTWRVNCVHTDTDSITYSLGRCLLP